MFSFTKDKTNQKDDVPEGEIKSVLQFCFSSDTNIFVLDLVLDLVLATQPREIESL